jgi:hypothetical protein
MSIEKVQERIVQWFLSESGGDSKDSMKIDTFVGEQFKNELNPKGMLSSYYNLIKSGKPINLQVLFK